MLRLEVLRDPSRFDALKAEWADLLSRSLSNSITLTHEWLRTWWNVYGEGRSLRLIAVREGDRLIGAAPLLLKAAPQVRFRFWRFRRIELLASGESPGHQVCSDYIDWIAEKGRESEVVPAILDCLCDELQGEWDEVSLPDVCEHSPILEALLRTAERKRLSCEVVRREPCSVIRLPRTWDEYLAALDSNLRYQIRRGRREVEKASGRYRVVERPEELRPAFDTLVGLHQARWTAKGKPGAFASVQRRAFHEQFLPLALENGWLRLGLLEGVEPWGAIYNLRYAGKVFFYQSGIKLLDNKHLRPGILMHSFEVESAIAAGLGEYDFLKRGHGEYKDSWSNFTRNLVTLRLARRGFKEGTLKCVWATYRGLRAMKHQLVR